MGRPVVHRSDEEEQQQQQRDEDASHSLNALATGLSPLFPFNYYYYFSLEEVANDRRSEREMEH
jgi:hypothetical protein